MTRSRWSTRTAGLVAVPVIAAALVGGLTLLQAPRSATPTERPTAAPSLTPPPTADPLPVQAIPSPEPWSSIRWRRVPEPFVAGDPEPREAYGLTSGNGLLLGWGRASDRGRNMGAVFVSRDGLVWRSVVVGDRVGPEDTSEIYAVVAGPFGFLAAGGVCCTVEERALWWSADGLRWTRAPLEPAAAGPDSWFSRIVGTRTGWVAGGAAGERPAIWSSPDGRSWLPVDLGLEARGSVADIANVGDRLVAVGTIDDAAGTHDGAVWTSTDGTRWQRVAERDPTLVDPDEAELGRLTPFAGGLFLTGNYGNRAERLECERLLGLVAAEGSDEPTTAISCGWGREHHWLSRDGNAWDRLPSGDPLPGQPAPAGERPLEFRLVAAGGPGLVNLAEDTRLPDGDSAVWVSADGRSWEPLDVAGDAPPSVQAGMVVVGRRVIAIGEAETGGIGVAVRIGEAR